MSEAYVNYKASLKKLKHLREERKELTKQLNLKNTEISLTELECRNHYYKVWCEKLMEIYHNGHVVMMMESDWYRFHRLMPDMKKIEFEVEIPPYEHGSDDTFSDVLIHIINQIKSQCISKGYSWSHKIGYDLKTTCFAIADEEDTRDIEHWILEYSVGDIMTVMVYVQ